MLPRPFLLLGLLGVIAACDGTVDPPDTQKDTVDTGPTPGKDADGDGWDETEDCDDQDPDVHPNGDEVCDSDDKDEDCDGAADDADADATGQTVVYADTDGDGYGDDQASAQRCDPQTGEVLVGGDCDDSNGAISPGSPEVCDGADVDEDCDGDADDEDDDATGTVSAYRDLDGDAYGDGAHPIEVCDPGPGTADNPDDCNDANYLINPDAVEVCGGEDEDCDGLTDDADDSVTATVDAYTDTDGDGYGDDSTIVQVCDTTGLATLGGDCDDADATRSPGMPEICDALDLDEDCNGVADDADAGTSDIVTAYVDVDADGYGDPADTLVTCDPPPERITTGGDCDDSNSAINPAATEVCDTADADEDCDGLADDADSSVDPASLSTFYKDSDKDAWGSDASTKQACARPAGYNENGGDCDDADSTVNPGKAEVCNDGIDNDCDADLTACRLTGDDRLSASLAEAKIRGTVPNETLGQFTSSVGDLDGDGVDDILVGARAADLSTTNAGAAWVFYGPVAGTFDTTSADVSFTGDASTSMLGTSATAGDFDGDGVNDLIISASGVIDGASTYAGAVRVYFGPLDAAETEASADLSWTTTNTDNFLGWALTHGDTNGDDVADVLFSAEADGAIYVFEGPLSRTGAPLASVTLSEAGVGDALFGLSVGDMDGDGLDEIAVSDRKESSIAASAGRIFIVAGASGTVTLATDADVIVDGSSGGDLLGTSLAINGDADGDGYADLVAGAPGADDAGTNRGVAAVFYGPLAGSLTRADANVRLDGPTTGTYAATALAYVGDLDADGATDLGIGSPGDDTTNTDAGAVFVLYGPITTSLDLEDADYRLAGESMGDQAGDFLAAGGDATGDGTDDLLVGAYQDDDGGHDAGAVYLIAGSGL